MFESMKGAVGRGGGLATLMLIALVLGLLSRPLAAQSSASVTATSEIEATLLAQGNPERVRFYSSPDEGHLYAEQPVQLVHGGNALHGVRLSVSSDVAGSDAGRGELAALPALQVAVTFSRHTDPGTLDEWRPVGEQETVIEGAGPGLYEEVHLWYRVDADVARSIPAFSSPFGVRVEYSAFPN